MRLTESGGMHSVAYNNTQTSRNNFIKNSNPCRINIQKRIRKKGAHSNSVAHLSHLGDSMRFEDGIFQLIIRQQKEPPRKLSFVTLLGGCLCHVCPEIYVRVQIFSALIKHKNEMVNFEPSYKKKCI